MHLLRRRRKRSGHTLVESVFACYVTLTCALVFSATVPVANASRGKGQNMAAATSLAYKTIENVRSAGYANLDSTTLTAKGYLTANTLVDIKAAGLTTATESGYEITAIDAVSVDSAGTVLPSGRAFVELSQVDIDLRSLVVVVFWKEGAQWRSVRVGTLVANM